MYTASALAILLALSTQLASAQTLCPGAAGDGTTDDSPALEACLGSDSVVEKAIQLKKGATYLISRSLAPKNRRWISGGADAQGVLTTLRCTTSAGSAFVVAGELEVRGIYVDGCSTGVSLTGNLTLVDSTVDNAFFALVVSGRGLVDTGPGARVIMRRSKILASHDGMLVSGIAHVVMDASEITLSSHSGVFFKKVKRKATVAHLELHSSVIRDSFDSAIDVESSSLDLLLAEQSSLQNSGGPCVSLVSSSYSLLHLESGSWIHGCTSGILLQGGFHDSVVIEGGSSIRASRTGVEVKHGYLHDVTVKDGSSIQRSSADGVIVRGGHENNIAISGQSSIEGSGGTAISVEGGLGHTVVVANGSALRHSSSHGVLLAAADSTLKIEDSAVSESGGSAVRVRPSGFENNGRLCMNVSMQNVYVARNSAGFWCQHTCVLGEIDGLVYLNEKDFHNSCSGSLSSHGPLAGTVGFSSLRASIWWCTLALAFGMASIPWLQVLRVCYHEKNSTGSFPALAMLVVVAALLLLVSPFWAQRMLDLWRIMKYVQQEDLSEIRLLFALAAASLLAPLASLIASRWWLRRWREAEIICLLRALEESLWQGDAEAEQLVRVRLENHGLSPLKILGKVQEIRRQQSHEAGVSVAYLISPAFLEFACTRTGLENPTFLQMKDPFWSGGDAVGKDVLCPRDGRPGCALVDTLHPRHRQRCTHFLSWVWRYPVLLVREALQIWTEEEGLDPSKVFLFMCFFVNNQFRILVEGTQSGSDDLETTFEQNLRRIGRVVALLDHWQQPLYLSRIWTIYEQYMAAMLQLPVTVILNQQAGESLIVELDKGKDGILRITDTLCNVHAEMAEASVKSDEEHVKAMIRSTIGFEYVNQRVRYATIDWVASVVRRHMDELVGNTKAPGGSTCSRRRLLRRISCTRLQGDVKPLAAMAVLEVEGPG